MQGFGDGAFLVCAVLFLFNAAYLRYFRRKDVAFLFFYGLLFFYGVVVVKYTLFPIPLEHEAQEYIRRTTTFESHYKYLPLWADEAFAFGEKEHLLNIALGIPLGFLVPFFKPLGLVRAAALGLLLGCGIEGSQLALSELFGAPYRTIDVNDVLFNFSGAMLGWLAFRLFMLLYDKNFDRRKRKRDAFSSLIGPSGQHLR